MSADERAGGKETVDAVQTQLALLKMPLSGDSKAAVEFLVAMQDEALRAKARFILLGLKDLGYVLAPATDKRCAKECDCGHCHHG